MSWCEAAALVATGLPKVPWETQATDTRARRHYRI
jgi:hypothetical protein